MATLDKKIKTIDDLIRTAPDGVEHEVKVLEQLRNELAAYKINLETWIHLLKTEGENTKQVVRREMEEVLYGN